MFQNNLQHNCNNNMFADNGLLPRPGEVTWGRLWVDPKLATRLWGSTLGRLWVDSNLATRLWVDSNSATKVPSDQIQLSTFRPGYSTLL